MMNSRILWQPAIHYCLLSRNYRALAGHIELRWIFSVVPYLGHPLKQPIACHRFVHCRHNLTTSGLLYKFC